ncbi:3'-5' exonuclease [Erythrobacter sp.]|nr:3'-5' exonuclease [Erythrobacter sp.]
MVPSADVTEGKIMKREPESSAAENRQCNCENDPDRRVLRTITPLAEWPKVSDPAQPTRLVAVIDSETTGFDPDEDAIIELAVALIEVDATGRIIKLLRKGSGTQDPGRPIPPRVTQITGITDADVAGRNFGREACANVLRQADVVLAHNSAFDRKFVERFIPDIEDLAWACSLNDFDWIGAGFDGAKLGHLINQIGLFAPKAHSALADVEALVNLLAHQLPDGETIIGKVLHKAAKPTTMIEVIKAYYSKRGEMKQRGYRWNPARSAWWVEVGQGDADDETAWVEETMPNARLRVSGITWHTRYQR